MASLANAVAVVNHPARDWHTITRPCGNAVNIHAWRAYVVSVFNMAWHTKERGIKPDLNQ
jgi:hypothetical protein